MDKTAITDEQFNKVIEDLKKLVKIKSLSNIKNEDYNFDSLIQCADFIKDEFDKLDFETKLITIDDIQPFVFSKKIIDENKPTILLYAHYDVQPVEKDRWDSDPFELVEKNNRLYARGASDDKAGIVAIFSAIRYFKEANKKLPVNLKVLIEGEEEYGSNHIEDILKKYKSDLQADALIVLDGANVATDIGTLGFSNRGNVNLKLTINALENPVHSGLGCLCPDAAQAMANIISSLNDTSKIEGINEGIKKLSDEEKKLLKENSISFKDYANEMKVIDGKESLRIDKNKSVFENFCETPIINILNLNAGKKEGGNSLQEEATAAINIRILPGQDPKKILKIITNHIEKQKVLYNLKLKIEVESLNDPFSANINGKYTKKYIEAMQKHFKKTSIMPSGGTLPLLKQFQDTFENLDILVPGVEDPDTLAHGHNESQDKELLRNTINTLIDFMKII
ncbi:MAG: putative succinyl-diaminopimelate desuccinylase [Candidatus Anoxychlamydiales bacterium]|nr:putative succinyl-diaminopimelate desuccinylase [Candidatus Anoxychlamydiales bacterium]